MQKEIGIICVFLLCPLAGDVYGDGQSLPIRIIGSQRRIFRMFEMFFENRHKAASESVRNKS